MLKKTLIASAIALAGISAAHAQVNLYGNIDVNMQRSKNELGQKVTGVESGGRGQSFIGFAGGEELGNGLKAGFKMEAGFNTDANAGALSFDRESYVSVSKAGAAVKVGRLESLSRVQNRSFDVLGEVGFANAANQFANYYDNAAGVEYKYGNFSVEGQYVFGETTKEVNTNSISAGRIAYADGPFKAAYTYTDAQAGGSSQNFGASYKYSIYEGFANYQDNKDLAVKNATTVGIKADVLPKTVVAATYVKADLKGGDEQKGYGLAADYSLSNRTGLYTTYLRTEADKSGNDTNLFNVGVKHRF